MKSFKEYLNEVAKPTGDLKKAYWTGYTAVGTKKKNGRTVPNCVPEEVELEEASLHGNRKISPEEEKVIHKKTLKMVKHSLAGYLGDSKAEKYHFTKATEIHADIHKSHGKKHADHAMHASLEAQRIQKVPSWIKEEVEFYEQYDAEELFDILEEIVDGIADENNLTSDILWENLEDVSDEELFETAAWRRKEGKNPTGGLNRKGIMSYRRENPGSKLKMAVTGKVKPGSKAAKRRKSFCARMSGMKGPMKKPNGKPTRKALALRKWRCR